MQLIAIATCVALTGFWLAALASNITTLLPRSPAWGLLAFTMSTTVYGAAVYLLVAAYG